MGRQKKIVVFRWLTLATIPVACFLKLIGNNIIFIEPKGMIRDLSWVDRLKKLGVDWVDYGSLKSYDVSAYLILPARYADILIKKQFVNSDFSFLSAIVPASTKNKARSVLFDTIYNIIRPYSLAYATADHFKKLGYNARIYQPRTTVFSILKLSQYTNIKNLCPFWVNQDFIGLINRIYKNSGKYIKIPQNIVNKVHLGELTNKKQITEIRESGREKKANILYFPHKGISYSNLFQKDIFYSTELENPLHRNQICHIELTENITANERISISNDYRRNNIEPTFIDKNPISVLNLIQLFIKNIRTLNKNKNTLHRAFILALTTLQINRYVKSFELFKGSKLALIGYSFLFPKPAAIALQTMGIKTIAVQERFFLPFMLCFAPILDVFFVHGKITQKAMENRAYAVLQDIIISGDPMHQRIPSHKRVAQIERKNRFGQYSKVCLVLDFHSLPDPFTNACSPGIGWVDNLYFYNTIIAIAKENTSCVFIIRGKNCDWLEIPAFLHIKNSISLIPNLEIDTNYDISERSYQIAAMSDFVIARLTSLCDQCLAEDIPVFAFDAMANGDPITSYLHDYSPYPIMVFDEKILRQRVKNFIEHSRYMPKDKLKKMQRDYYGKGEINDPQRYIKDTILELLKC